MPKVSVLMTAYNSGEYIAEAIDSILNQTFGDFEFIIINDGSTDNTADIVRKYTDKRIKFIDNKKNQGLIAVLNQGLDLCTGEYIARMDSDDISLPERFALQVAYMDAHPDVGVLGTALKTFGKEDTTHIYKSVITCLDLIVNSPVAHATVFIRRNILTSNNLRYRPEYIHAEDYDLWARCVRVTKIRNIPNILYLYRRHDASVCFQFNAIQSEKASRIRTELMEYLTDIPELQRRLYKIAHDAQFFNPTYLSRHMMWHHPIRYFRLNKTIKGLTDE